MSANRVPVTARLRPADFAFFTKAANECGLTAGTAARQIIELVIRHMRENGADYVATLNIVNRALKAGA